MKQNVIARIATEGSETKQSAQFSVGAFVGAADEVTCADCFITFASLMFFAMTAVN